MCLVIFEQTLLNKLIAIFCFFLIACSSDKHEALKFEVLKQTNKVIEDQLLVMQSRIFKRVEEDASLAESFVPAIKSIDKLESKITIENLQKTTYSELETLYFNKLDSLVLVTSLFANFDLNKLDKRSLAPNSYSNSDAAILLSNTFARNKLKLAEYCIEEMTEIQRPLNEVVSVSHKNVDGDVILYVKLDVELGKVSRTKLQEVIVNGKKLKDRYVAVGGKRQLLNLNLGKLKNGEHRFNAVLYFVRNDFPVEYDIGYDFKN